MPVLPFSQFTNRFKAKDHRRYHRVTVAALTSSDVVLVARHIGHDAGFSTLLVCLEECVARIAYESFACFAGNVLLIGAHAKRMFARRQPKGFGAGNIVAGNKAASWC